MSLRRFVVENYRCFRDRQELEISPVTVVLGKNNSGKSALVRAPLILATGFDTPGTAPLELDRFGPESVDAFTDLIFGQSRHGFLYFEVEGERFHCGVRLQYLDETRDAFVEQLTLRMGEYQAEYRWLPDATATAGRRVYQVSGAEPSELEFRGLLPVGPGRPPGLSIGPIRYLSSRRERQARQHRLPLGVPAGLGPQGQNLSGILAHDRVRGGAEVIATVNRYLRDIVPGWQLDEVDMGPLWATVLTRTDNPYLKVNLADAGAGLGQVLPILVQCALDEQRALDEQHALADDPALQIIEEPETHLHPAAHAELADLYLATARATGTRFLIETHSETLLLRLRRRVAEGAYPADMVGVYVVEQTSGVSTLRRVDLDELGNLGEEWPQGYFSQDYHEVRALASAQLRRSGAHVA